MYHTCESPLMLERVLCDKEDMMVAESQTAKRRGRLTVKIAREGESKQTGGFCVCAWAYMVPARRCLALQDCAHMELVWCVVPLCARLPVLSVHSTQASKY